jgi:hypothetical protein
MDNHWNTKHKDLGGIAAQDVSVCKVQTFFLSHPKYFAVMPVMKGLGPQDKYRLYLTQLADEVAEADATIVPAVSENQVPALLQVTLWHEHLATFTTDKATVRNTRSLVDTWAANEKTPWLGTRLSGTVTEYMQVIKRRMANIPIPARSLLMEYPRQASVSIVCYGLNTEFI